MKIKKNNLALDCVAMKRSIQTQLAAETRGLSHEEELEFYRRRVAAGSLATFWKSIGGEAVQGAPSGGGEVRRKSVTAAGRAAAPKRRASRRSATRKRPD